MRNSARVRRCGGPCTGRSCRTPWASRRRSTIFLGTPALVAPPPRAGLGRPAIAADTGARRVGPRGARAGPRRSPRARGAWCRGATARSPRGGPGSAPRASRRRTTGATVDSRPRSGSSANAPSGRATAPSTISSTCPRPRRCARWCGSTHQRWAIEQQYQELKDELGLDHFEGRSFPGWHRHVVLTALAYTWLQCERQRRGTHPPTLPGRARRDHRDPDRPFLRDAPALSAHHAETGRNRSPDLTNLYEARCSSGSTVLLGPT